MFETKHNSCTEKECNVCIGFVLNCCQCCDSSTDPIRVWRPVLSTMSETNFKMLLRLMSWHNLIKQVQKWWKMQQCQVETIHVMFCQPIPSLTSTWATACKTQNVSAKINMKNLLQTMNECATLIPTLNRVTLNAHFITVAETTHLLNGNVDLFQCSTFGVKKLLMQCLSRVAFSVYQCQQWQWKM